MPPVRGKLRQVKPRGEALRFQYNPSSVRQVPTVPRYREQARPRDKDALEYDGRSLERISFTLRLDGFPKRSIESEIRLLESFGKPRSKGKPPPDLVFDYGPAGRSKLWRIDGLDPQDGELRRSDLARVQIDYSVTLVELEEPTVALSPVGKRKKKNAPASKTYVVRSGDTLAQIAAREFGDASRWPEIAALNGIRDPSYLGGLATLVLPEG